MAPRKKKGPLATGKAHTRRALRKERAAERHASNDLRNIAFANHYRQHFNASEAAIAAGHPAGSAYQRGYELLHSGPVQELLNRYALDAVALTNVRVQDIMKALSEIAYCDPGELFEQVINPRSKVVTLRLRDITELPIEVRRAIASFKVVKKNLIAGDGFIDTIIEVKFWPKTKALDLLAQHKGALSHKSEDVATARQLEKMSDEELGEKLAEAQERWAKHTAARQRMRLAVSNTK